MNHIPESARKLALEFIDFVNLAVSPFHVVQQGTKVLKGQGFIELIETQNWNLQPGGRYYFTRNLTTLIAFVVGKEFEPNNTGFKIIGAHTDSPCLHLTPVSKLNQQGVHQACVSTYGGGLWHTWFDRDLTVAGRVLYCREQKYEEQLFHHPKPILKIPNLAIHLQSSNERGKFEPNTENHLRPVFSTQAYEQLTGIKETKDGPQKHYQQLYNLIEKHAGIKSAEIVELDFVLCDTQPAQLVGVHEEFLSSPRLDNLMSTFQAISALSNLGDGGSWISMAALFDHEECGSGSAQGADSNIMNNSLQRIYGVLSNGRDQLIDSYQKALNSSFIISADLSHGIHPNYPEKHQTNHKIKLNEGVVIKHNHNQRYSTDSVSATLLRAVADRAQVPIQDFIVKNDSPCGTTIGPLISSQTCIKTIDIGIPQWSMHSIRETCGIIDIYYYNQLFQEFYRSFEKINHNLLGQ